MTIPRSSTQQAVVERWSPVFSFTAIYAEPFQKEFWPKEKETKIMMTSLNQEAPFVLVFYIYIHLYTGFRGVSVIKNPPAKAGDVRDPGLIPGLGRSPEGENSYPLQYCCLGNPMDREAWWAIVHGVTESQTQVND